MTDNKDINRTIEDIISDEIDRQYSHETPRTITPAQLEAMVAGRQRAKRRRVLRKAGFAAVFVLAVIGTALIFSTFTTDVGADKNAKEEIRTEDGVVIEDGGWGSSSEDCVTITEWEDVETYRISNPRIVALNYIPERFAFDELRITWIEIGDVTCEYLFSNEETGDKLEIEEFIPVEEHRYFEVNNVSRELSSTKGVIYVQEDKIKRAIIQMDDGISIKVNGMLSDEEIIKVIDSLKY